MHLLRRKTIDTIPEHHLENFQMQPLINPCEDSNLPLACGWQGEI